MSVDVTGSVSRPLLFWMVWTGVGSSVFVELGAMTSSVPVCVAMFPVLECEVGMGLTMPLVIPIRLKGMVTDSTTCWIDWVQVIHFVVENG